MIPYPNMNDAGGERRERYQPAFSYSNEQRELFRLLVVEEKCTVGMIHQLTGIPIGTISNLCGKLDIELTHKQGSMGGKLGAIQRARNLARIKEKHAERLKELFTRVTE